MIKQYISLLVVLIILSCATVQTPTGGMKDVKAPILYESSPKDQSTNFKGKKITLYFNEWMKVDQIQKELIISPYTDIKYESKLNKQELTITLEENLDDSTTYTFNFRKSLKDITEGNLWENPRIAFSTGDYLDSLQVKGTVKQLHNQKPAKNYLVGLYNAKVDTANLRQGKPLYFTTTTEEGEYILQNIKAGKYLLYTFKDENNDLRNQPSSEPYGFHSDTLILKDKLQTVNLTTYKNNEDTLKLKKSSVDGKDFVIQYNKGLSKYSITNPADSNQYIYATDQDDSKNLKIFKENFPQLAYEKDSVQLIVQVTDSLNNKKTDTVYYKIRESRITNAKLSIDKKSTGELTYGYQELSISLSKPAASITYDSIQLRLDTIPIRTIKAEEIQANYNRKTYTIGLLFEKEKLNQLIDSVQHIRDSIATSIADTTNSSTNNNQSDTTINNTKNQTDQGKLALSKDVSRGNKSQKRGFTTSLLNLYFGQSSFIGIENDSTSSTSIKISFKESASYGIVKGSVQGAKTNFIIELLDSKYEVKDTIYNQTEFTFHYVKPGDYTLRLIIDKNSNHQWDAGNPLLLQQAEKIIYLDELFPVKANWEVIDKNFNLGVDKHVDDSGQTDDL